MKFQTLLLFCAIGCPATLVTCNEGNRNANNSITSAPNNAIARVSNNSNFTLPASSPALSPSLSSTKTAQSDGASMKEEEPFLEARERCRHTPIPKVSVSKTNGAAPLTVTFDGSASHDPDKGKVVGWHWWFNSENYSETITREGKIIKYTFDQPGRYLVSISVRDDQGQSSSDCSGGILAAEIIVTDPKDN